MNLRFESEENGKKTNQTSVILTLFSIYTKKRSFSFKNQQLFQST